MPGGVLLDRCPHCEKTYLTARVEAGCCPMCGQSLSAPKADTASKIEHLNDFSPLMEREEISFFGRFWGTLAQVLLRPSLFFSNLNVGGAPLPNSNRAFLFGLLVLFTGQIVSAYWLIAVAGQSLDLIFQGSPEQAILGALLGKGDAQVSTQELSYLVHAASVQAHVEFILAPVIAFFAIHLIAGGCHFLGRSMQSDDAVPPPFDATLRWVAYAHAPFIFAAVPSLGSLVATGWTGILLVRGLVAFYGLSFARALVTVGSLGLLLKVFWASALHRISLYLLTTFFPHLSP